MLNLKKLTLLALLSYPILSSADVTVYKHCSYRGNAVTLPVGRYTLADLNRLGIRNDDISSLKVSGGYGIRIYQHDNFIGDTLGFLKNDSCLVNNGFNDKTSSIEVTRQNFGNKYFQFRAMNSQKCLDVKSASRDNRANVYIYQCTNRDNQGWKLTRIQGNEYKIVSKRSNKYLDVASRSRVNGANVHQWSWENLNNQKWIVTSKMTTKGVRYQIKAKHSGKCLTSSGKKNRSNVTQQTCSNAKEPRHQLWRLKKLSYSGT